LPHELIKPHELIVWSATPPVRRNPRMGLIFRAVKAGATLAVARSKMSTSRFAPDT